ncbi:hypothetical protein BG454_00460 [Roseinatronobacter bogoriensis subsp. barguzinensis]|uniref:Uncharacterized protein n=1 Tax=Roseinatronobacter bogoriensis subsp. barguzinensis TaxID=441209 RepID=A0A2K8K4V7_9RHOB|nr:hypothetical protein BG454_00460 [Rhodobaca barguzinensis]
MITLLLCCKEYIHKTTKQQNLKRVCVIFRQQVKELCDSVKVFSKKAEYLRSRGPCFVFLLLFVFILVQNRYDSRNQRTKKARRAHE